MIRCLLPAINQYKIQIYTAQTIWDFDKDRVVQVKLLLKHNLSGFRLEQICLSEYTVES